MLKTFYFYLKILFINFFLYSFAFKILNINPKYLPNFYLITVFFFIMKYLYWHTVIIIFFYGMFLDIFEMGMIGLNSFAFFSIYLIMHKFFKKTYINSFSQDNCFTRQDFLIIFIFSVFFYILKFIILKLSKHEIYFNFIFLYKSIINAIFSLILFKIFSYEKR